MIASSLGDTQNTVVETPWPKQRTPTPRTTCDKGQIDGKITVTVPADDYTIVAYMISI